MGLGEGAREQIVRYGEAAQEFELALAKARGLGAFGFAVHIVAIMLQGKT
jgi:hypothetical protein